jgi:hypothetical protein
MAIKGEVMRKQIAGIIIGLILGTIISVIAATKYESRSIDAQSIVGYGSNGTVIIPIAVDDTGRVKI